MTEQIQTQKPNAGSAPAMLFFKELMENVETLTGIADQHGARTLADIMYLQNAVLDGSFIELYPDESVVLKIVDELPSAAIWRQFIQMTVSESRSMEPESKLLRDAKQLVADIQAMAQPITTLEPEPDLDGSGEFENHYLCTCGEQWQDTWSSACNDRCPACNREIEPYASDDGSMTDEEIDAALKRVADMRQYLIAGAPNGWTHIFAGFGEFVVRFVFDRKQQSIIAMQVSVSGGGAWRNATPDQIADVEDSVKNANVEAIADPYGSGYGLIATDDLPAWAEIA